ncbi:hypothetical protein JL09_g5483 [Pichia kudriavzevii]|uniref:Cytochrome b mRNA-processing protein 4 n=2 Tax=Pichia kudriavzevii TaxID=4909 RepID=A0A099NU15_PICKU|nr:hypothetical protein JL09_g5483 [Pichia kudriavzevii]
MEKSFFFGFCGFILPGPYRIGLTKTPVKTMLRASIIYGGGIVGLGVLLFKFTVPTEEQLLQEMTPERRAHVERNRAIRQEEQRLVMEIARETANSNEPVWKTGKLYNPWEGTGNKLLVDSVKVQREEARVRQQEKLNSLRDMEQELKK